MPIEEAGGWCDYCQRPVLGRRQGVNHVVFALLTLFSCGLFGLVWILLSLVGSNAPYSCPTCGHQIRAGASGPAALGAAAAPAPPRAWTAEEIASLRARNRRTALIFGLPIGALVMGGIIVTVVNEQRQAEITRRLAPPSPASTTTTTLVPAHAYRTAAEGERTHLLGQVVRSALLPCAATERSFYQGGGGSATGDFWNVGCNDGNAYVVQVKSDGTTKVLPCKTAASLGLTPCFRKMR